MRITLNDPYTYIVMLLRNDLPKEVFAEIDIPANKRHTPLMEILQKIIKEGLKVSAESIYTASANNKQIVAEYMALLNDIDYKEMQRTTSLPCLPIL